MKDADHGPRSGFARYAFGYSDEKPCLALYLILYIATFAMLAAKFA